jgi:hypothetical protein
MTTFFEAFERTLVDRSNDEARVWFDFTGNELRAYFDKRAVWYEGRATYLKDLAAKMPKSQQIEAVPEEAQQFYTGQTMAVAEKNIEEQAKQAERHGRRFRLLGRHVNPTVTFKLTENDIDRFELTSCF